MHLYQQTLSGIHLYCFVRVCLPKTILLNNGQCMQFATWTLTITSVSVPFFLQMRLLLDGSCVECYLGSGEVLSTRIYRGNAPRGSDSGIELVSFGGTANVPNVQAWELKSIWQKDSKMRTGSQQTMYESENVMGAPIPA